MSSDFVEETIRLTEKYYDEMRKSIPNFTTTDKEHLLVTSAISFVLKEKAQ